MASRKQNGFSMLELIVVIGIALIMAGVTAVAVPRVFQQEHLDTSYNTTLNFLRRAHDLAAGDLRVYVVTFSLATGGPNPTGGTIAAVDPSTGVQLFSETLPPDVTYHVEPGSPNTTLTTPDGFGTASNGAFDFDWGAPADVGGGNTIYFYPDGTAHDAAGHVNNGVVYLGVPGNLNTCRAVSLWGYTGRLRGWQLTKVGAVWTWSQR